MFIHNDKNFAFFFGGTQTCNISHNSSDFPVYCKNLCKKLNINNLTILRQNHGTNGIYINQENQKKHASKVINLFSEDGDFLSTSIHKIGICVLTADCLPIVIYDTKNKVISIVHAGWRGTVLNIVNKAIQQMKKIYTTNPNDLRVWFGPAAKACCYEVQQDFRKNLDSSLDKSKLLIKRNNKIFFDVGLYNTTKLIASGVKTPFISYEYNKCTICNPKFHSYRRDGQKSLRQLSIAWLK